MYVPLVGLLDKCLGSVYKLVVLVAKRALEIAEGQPRLIDDLPASMKPATVALHEIRRGLVFAKIAKA